MSFYISRRKAITLIGAFVATSTTLGGISVIRNGRDNAVFAQEKANSKQKLLYKGREILIQQDDSSSKGVEGEFKLFISGKRIDLGKDKKTGRFISGYLPFDDFTSLTDMAKEIIDLGAVEFDRKKPKLGFF
ncbi:hypothetical protein [Aliterella atlantica]|uniref:Uncharacterized protein n=1 Tax=Aliterella atlantica CENA595 TaxID=1618023 RepID=A0A0D9A1E2_9CYAN|nr:hypothetical protein [Aliterella atlantica]KJH73276.1 hypothetical protein UH38_00255 [Aliterella atlantica CENA595]